MDVIARLEIELIYYNLAVQLVNHYATVGLVWLFGFYGISTFVGYSNAKSVFMKIVLFQTIQFSISTQFKREKIFYF